MPDRYKIGVIGNQVNLNNEFEVSLYDNPRPGENNFLWISINSFKESLDDYYLFSLLDENKEMIQFTGRISSNNFLYKYPKKTFLFQKTLSMLVFINSPKRV